MQDQGLETHWCYNQYIFTQKTNISNMSNFFECFVVTIVFTPEGYHLPKHLQSFDEAPPIGYK